MEPILCGKLVPNFLHCATARLGDLYRIIHNEFAVKDLEHPVRHHVTNGKSVSVQQVVERFGGQCARAD